MQTQVKNKTSLSTTLTIRVDAEMKDKLEASAQQQQRSKSFIASEAIAGYLALQEWQDARVRTALKSALKGEGLIPHADVVSWIATLK
jgi:predicted transcriptional regulator